MFLYVLVEGIKDNLKLFNNTNIFLLLVPVHFLAIHVVYFTVPHIKVA